MLAEEIAAQLGMDEPQQAFADAMVRLRDSCGSQQAFEAACSAFGAFDPQFLENVYSARISSAGDFGDEKDRLAGNNDESTSVNTDSEPDARDASRAREDLEQDREWYDQRATDDPEIYSEKSIDRPDSHSKLRLYVAQRKPPFLSLVSAKAESPVSPVKDPESRMAMTARSGSALVKLRRSQKERAKQARSAASNEGTFLGKIDDSQQRTKSQRQVKRAAKRLSRDDILKQRQSLPAFAVRDALLTVIRENQVTIVVGETGSGKTTQLGQFLIEAGFADHGIICCTQPRRVAAMSVAERVSVERGVKLGTEVGYSIRFEDETGPETKLKFMTDGILLREALSEPLLDKYQCIIIDEAHERALNTDIILGLLRRVLAARQDLKLIVTSATLNANRFSQFFGGAPQFTIPGRTFPVHVNNLTVLPDDYVAASVKQILSIHLQKGPGDILVFMTGQDDIEATCDELRAKMKLLTDPQPLEILPIYSQMPQDLQARIFLPAPPGVRKVVVATNIAETSLTVDGIRYVIDGGYAKLKVYKPQLGVDTLQLVPISVANAGQRSGRAGRTSEGFCYRMYPKALEQSDMYAQTVPEIQRTNLANTILLLKTLGVDNVSDFDFLDPPSAAAVSASQLELWTIGALDNSGALTRLGKELSNFPMDPHMARLLIAGVEDKCIAETLTIVSMMSVPNVFYRPLERAKESDSAREKFFVPQSDHLTLLNVYRQWKARGSSAKWASDHFLHMKSLQRADDVRQQLERLVKGLYGLSKLDSTDDWDSIRRSVCKAYFHQAARTKGLQSYAGMQTNVLMKLHPTSALYGLGYLAEYVVYHELILTTQQYMTVVTAVEPEWLLEDGKVMYYTEGTQVEEIQAVEAPKTVFKRSRVEKTKPKRRFMRGV